MSDHDQNLARAFDSQAPLFERAPVQSDPIALERLVREAELPAGCLVLDAGCGPGLVSAAPLGSRISSRWRRPLARNDRAGAEALFASRRARRFMQLSVFDPAIDSLGPFDAAVSRYVLHHVEDPPAFLARQIALLDSNGVFVVNDHITDPDPEVAKHHSAIEIARDRTHVRNLTGGELVDLFAAAGLTSIRYVEEPFTLDFDEWFDRGTPSATKAEVRRRLLEGPIIRSFRPQLFENGSIRIDCFRAIVRGIKT